MTATPRTLVIIPTYNERASVAPVCRAVLSATSHHVHVLVVDDASPDGTGDIVRHLLAGHPRLHLLSRPGKQGLGRAYVAGFAWALDHDFDLIVQMDADGSHRPADLVKLLAAIASADFAIGSRYVPGGETANWAVSRKLLSKAGSLYARTLLGYPLKDWTGGFNAWHRHVLQGIRLDSVSSSGYGFQIEVKLRALRAGFRGIEVPIRFEERRVGASKMSLGIVAEAVQRVWRMRNEPSRIDWKV